MQGLGDVGDEAPVGTLEHERERPARFQRRVGDAGVVERPVAQLPHELVGKRAERCALGAQQHDHHRLAVGQTIVEQLTRQGVVARAFVQLADVFDRAQSTDALTRATRQLLH